MKPQPSDSVRVIQAGFLAWLLPGAGHFVLGHRGLGIVFFAAISFAYWTGIAVGGVKNTVNYQYNPWLFLAEMGAGGYTLPCALLGKSLPTKPANEFSEYVSYPPNSDIAQIYLAVAGLLNVLAILDALARAQTGGQPVFYHEITRARQAQEPPAGGGP